jgi:hypothetical protein
VEPIDWILFTSEPIGTLRDRGRRGSLSCPTVIEQYFKALKMGCSFEKRQLTSYDGSLGALGLFVPMASMLLALLLATSAAAHASQARAHDGRWAPRCSLLPAVRDGRTRARAAGGRSDDAARAV